MAYDEGLAERIRDHLGDTPGITEKPMFGGLSFLLHGNMSVGIVGEELCVRVGKERHDELVSEPGARIMDFTGRPMQGWLFVAPEGFDDDADLAVWVSRGLDFAASLPPK